MHSKTPAALVFTSRCASYRVIQGFGDTDLEFRDLVEVILFAGEVAGHGWCSCVVCTPNLAMLAKKKKARTGRVSFQTKLYSSRDVF